MARTGALLRPLIGEAAFRACVRTHWLLIALAVAVPLGLAAAFAAALSSGALRSALALVWLLCALACVIAAFLGLIWSRRANALTSDRLTSQLDTRFGFGAGARGSMWRRGSARSIGRCAAIARPTVADGLTR
ncbi:MAG: hypothetical protein ACREN7_06290 [Candidatus Dormibacteria bacterium]